MGRSVPVSVRLSPEDASFLAALEIDGCVTVSQKIRHVVSQARMAAQAKEDVTQDQEVIGQKVEPFRRKIAALEASGQSAVFLRQLCHWLPAVMAMIEVAGETATDLGAIEIKARDKMLDILDHMARQALTEESLNLNSHLFSDMRPNLIEILKILAERENHKT